SVADDFYNIEEATMNLSISGEINIYPNVNNYNIEDIKTFLIFQPKETWRQKIISSNTEPEAEITEDSVNFEWKNTEKKKLTFKTDYTIKTNQQIKKIKRKINFPITNILAEYIQYTKPTENIDSGNKEIIK
ncbi:unnamed protein product, partial [marine sediment metagenome]